MARAPSQPPELPGYAFLRNLGAGGFSDVFLYEQQLPRRRVAVKVLLADALTPASRAAFVAEANVMAQLSSHPYIVTIYQAGVSADDRPYLVMEYAPGASLAERYKRAPFPVEEALRTGVRLSSAVATAHAAGILHRDIKPANVLSNEFGWPALTDFGIASAAQHDGNLPVHTTTRGALDDTAGGDTGQTESRSVGLSVPWSPPEMFDDDPQPDFRSDVFSLAATIYTLLAGQTPFEQRGRSNGTVDLMGRIERGEITPLSRSDVPASLVAVLRKGMDVERERRFATAVDFARALQRVELELGFAPTTIDVPNVRIEDVAPEDDGAEATRLRGVSVVEAQAEPTPAEAATRLRSTTIIAEPEPSGPVGEHTVVRERPEHAAAAPAATAAEPPVVPSPPVAPARRRPVGLIAGIAGAVALIAAIVVGVVMLSDSGLLVAPDPVQSETSALGGGSAVVGDAIAQPEDLVVERRDATSVVVRLTNPEYQDGDAVRWHRLANPGQTAVIADTGPEVEFVIEDAPDDVELCIGVVIQRAGQWSPVTEACAS